MSLFLRQVNRWISSVNRATILIWMSYLRVPTLTAPKDHLQPRKTITIKDCRKGKLTFLIFQADNYSQKLLNKYKSKDPLAAKQCIATSSQYYLTSWTTKTRLRKRLNLPVFSVMQEAISSFEEHRLVWKNRWVGQEFYQEVKRESIPNKLIRVNKGRILKTLAQVVAATKVKKSCYSKFNRPKAIRLTTTLVKYLAKVWQFRHHLANRAQYRF